MAAYQVQDPYRPSTIFKIVDSLIIGYLRKRGYDQTESSLLAESVFLKNRDPSRPFLISTTLNDKSLEEIVETFYNHGRFDAPPELLVMEQQLRDFSSTFTSFVVNYSRATQEKVLEKQRRFMAQQQQQMQQQQVQMQQQQIALRQQARRNFVNINDVGPRQQRSALQRAERNSAVFQPPPQPVVMARPPPQVQQQPHHQQLQFHQENRNIPIAQNQIQNGHFVQQQEQLQQHYDQPQIEQEQYIEPMDQSVQQMQDQQIAEMIQQQENEEFGNTVEGASKRKSKPRNEMEVAARAFVNIIEGVQTAIETSSTESLWDTLPHGELPMDEEVSCKLLLQYVNEYPTDESLLDLRDQMDIDQIQILPPSATPPVAETVTVETEAIAAPPIQETSKETAPSPVKQTNTPQAVVPVLSLPPAPEPLISPPPPSAPMYAPRKFDPVRAGVVTSDSTTSELSTASQLSTDVETAQKAMSMDDLFGNANESSSIKAPAPVEKPRKPRQDQRKPAAERAPSKGGDHHQHKRKDSQENRERIAERSPTRVHESPRRRTDSQDRPSSNSSAASDHHRPSSPPARHDSNAPSTSRHRTPPKSGGRNRASSPSFKNNNRNNRQRQQDHRRIDDKRSGGGGGSRKRNEPYGGSSNSSSKIGSRRRSSEEDRPPSRSNDSQTHRDPRMRSPDRRDQDKAARGRVKSSAPKPSSSEKKDEQPLKSILSKKNAQPKSTASLAGIESDVLSCIASNMDNLRKPEKPAENPFPTNPMFGFPITPKMPQIRFQIPKMKAASTGSGILKKAEEKTEVEKTQDKLAHEKIINGFGAPGQLNNMLPTGTISDSRLTMMLTAITNKRLEASGDVVEKQGVGESPAASARVSQLYDLSDGQEYQGYQASVEQPEETPPRSAKRPKIDPSQMEKVMSRLHGSTP